MVISDELLHEMGWRSHITSDEVYFTFGDLTLLSDSVNEVWGFVGYKYYLKSWEELLVAFKEIKDYEFIAGEPVMEENQYIFESSFN